MVESSINSANANVPFRHEGEGNYLVRLQISCPRPVGTCCSESDRQKEIKWCWSGNSSDPTYLDPHGMLVSLSYDIRDEKMHIF